MIPKIIHYCWFGRNKKSELILKCIESWKKYLPGWKIIEWNEDNYNVNKADYIREAYVAKKWAFVSDYARFDILYQYGGVYLDTDVEFIKPLPESLLTLEGFTGFETTGLVNPGLIFGINKGSKLIKEILDTYNSEHFVIPSNGIYKTVNLHMEEALQPYGLVRKNEKQIIKGIEIFPSEYFCGFDTDLHEPCITENTICWHHYTGSWSKADFKSKLQKVIVHCVGKKNYKRLLRIKRKDRGYGF